jgi:murein DD-endopeptidase MepM/ murein hydrolase activator NlpD
LHRFDLKRAVICAALFVFLVSHTVAANDLKDAKDERSEIQNKIIDTIREKESRKELVQEKENQIIEVDNELTAGRSAVAELEAEFRVLVDGARSAGQMEASAAKDLENNSSAARESILRLYKNANSTYLSFINDSANVFEMLGRLSYVRRIIDSDKDKIKASILSLEEASAGKASAIELARRKNSEIRDLDERMGELEISRSGIKRDIVRTTIEITDLESRTEELKEYSLELVEKIKQLQKNSKEYVGGKMLWPAPSSRVVVSYFGIRIHPIYHIRKMHRGIDIAASYRSEIVAANDGIVITSGYVTGYGYTVIIDHGGGIATLYGHCSKLKVKTGDLVFKGDLIALVGSSGLSTGPHLHFEVRVNGAQKDPFKYLERKP